MATDLRELPRRPALNAGPLQGADLSPYNHSCGDRRHGVADLAPHARVRRTPCVAAAVREHEVIREGLQPRALTVGQPTWVNVVVAVGAATAVRDNCV